MPPPKELCRNFQRGSCKYGQRCKFLHAAPQQSKSNPFGFSVPASSPFQQNSQQQQMPNPFGFGVQNKTQLRGGNDFGSKQGQYKPFENTWSRFSPLNSNNASASRSSDNSHKCTDPESCKRIIVEDLQNEPPQWKLTCYGHNRDAPCDIVGDISFEELRALAYEEAKHGKNLQFIVERERSLLNSKLVEFQNLLQKPNMTAPSQQGPFAGMSTNTPAINTGVSPVASSFTPFNASPNTGPVASANYTFGQPNALQNNSQSSSVFQMSNSPFNTSGVFGQVPQQSVQRSFPFGSAISSNTAGSAPKNPFLTFSSFPQTGNAAGSPFQNISAAPSPASNGTGLSSISTTQLIDTKLEKSNVDDSVWKAQWKWNCGEIPEEAPPDIYVDYN